MFEYLPQLIFLDNLYQDGSEIVLDTDTRVEELEPQETERKKRPPPAASRVLDDDDSSQQRKKKNNVNRKKVKK